MLAAERARTAAAVAVVAAAARFIDFLSHGRRSVFIAAAVSSFAIWRLRYGARYNYGVLRGTRRYTAAAPRALYESYVLYSTRGGGGTLCVRRVAHVEHHSSAGGEGRGGWLADWLTGWLEAERPDEVERGQGG